MPEKNGKWQLAFWIITVLFVIVASSIISAVVANDRIREASDNEIEEKLTEKIDKKYEDINRQLIVIRKENSEQFQRVIVAIARLETKIGDRHEPN